MHDSHAPEPQHRPLPSSKSLALRNSTGPHLLPHHDMVGQHLGDRRPLRQQDEFLSRWSQTNSNSSQLGQ